MFKKIGIMVILLGLLFSVNLVAQSNDVDVHNVLRSGSDVELWRKNAPDDNWFLEDTKPAPEGTGYTTVTFHQVANTQSYNLWGLRAEQGSRSVVEVGGFSPFTTIHLYLPIIDWPQDDIPETQ